MFSADDKVLSYGNSLLRKSDVTLLDDRQWLNDQIIGFVYEYYEREKFSELCKDVSFMSPETTQFIKLTREYHECGLFLEHLELERKKFIFFPVNNNEEPESIGGTHWSLLMYNKSDNEFLHYDSLHGFNIKHASMMKEKLKYHLKDGENARITQKDCPQQINCYDCGMHVVCCTDALCCSLVEGRPDATFHVNFDANKITEERSRLKKLIETLSKCDSNKL